MINVYNETRDCIYKDEHYSVRDNGAVMRHLRIGKKARKDDGVWTFGNKDLRNGYMMLGKHRVHIIVATAFYGERDTATFVVDHKDTNRCNNRIENLHWLTKLEHILSNDIPRNKIIRICGSIEAFIENPQLLQKSNMPDTSFEWMRAVTAEEAKIAYENIKKYWDEQARNPHPISGTRMDDNIYHKQLNPSKRYQTPDMSTPKMFDTLSDTSFDTNDNRHVVTDDDWERMTKSFREPIAPIPIPPTAQITPIENNKGSYQYTIEPQLTKAEAPETAWQKDWRTPSSFVCCPETISNQPLEDYYNRLVIDENFNITRYQNSDTPSIQTIVDKAYIDDNSAIIVLTYNDNSMKPFALAKIYVTEGKFIHESQGTYFYEDGARKDFTLAQGLEWDGGECFDDYC